MTGYAGTESSVCVRSRFPLSPFVRSLLVLAAGSTSAKIITLLALPILTRLYRPEDFGVLALFTSIVAITAPMATLRFNQAIPLALSGRSAACLAALSLLGAFALAIILLPIGFVATQLPVVASAIGPVLPYWPLVILGLFAAVIFDIVYFAGIRRQLHKEIAQAFFVRSAVGTLVKIGGGVLGLGALSLVTGQIMQLSGGGTFILRKLGGSVRQRLARLSWRALRSTARRYRSYPTIIMPSSLAVALGMQAPIFMMTALYDARTVGLFAFAMTVMAVPINILNQTIGNAYFGEISRIKRSGDGSIVALTLKLVGVIGAIGLVLASIAWPFAAPVAAVVLGEEWRSAGLYMSYMALYAGMQVASSPLMSLFLTQKKHGKFGAIASLRLILVLMLWVYGTYYAVHPERMVLLVCLALFSYYLTSLVMIMFELRAMQTIKVERVRAV